MKIFIKIILSFFLFLISVLLFLFFIYPCYNIQILKMMNDFPHNINQMDRVASDMELLNKSISLKHLYLDRDGDVVLNDGKSILDLNDKKIQGEIVVVNRLLTEVKGLPYSLGSLMSVGLYEKEGVSIYFTLDSGGVLGPSYGYLKNINSDTPPESTHSFHAIPISGYPGWYIFHHPKIIERYLRPSLICRALSFVSECVGKKKLVPESK